MSLFKKADAIGQPILKACCTLRFICERGYAYLAYELIALISKRMSSENGEISRQVPLLGQVPHLSFHWQLEAACKTRTVPMCPCMWPRGTRRLSQRSTISTGMLCMWDVANMHVTFMFPAYRHGLLYVAKSFPKWVLHTAQETVGNEVQSANRNKLIFLNRLPCCTNKQTTKQRCESLNLTKLTNWRPDVLQVV